MEWVWVLFLHRGLVLQKKGKVSPSGVHHLPYFPCRIFPVCGYWGFLSQFGLSPILRCCFSKCTWKIKMRVPVWFMAHVLNVEKCLLWRRWLEGSSISSGTLAEGGRTWQRRMGWWSRWGWGSCWKVAANDGDNWSGFTLSVGWWKKGDELLL